MAIEIKGNWVKGYALDVHTLSSGYLGDNEQGRPQFNTVRSKIGELLYKLKYKNDSSVIPQIVIEIKKHVTGIENFHFLISIPPSNTDRILQPVNLVSEKLSLEYKIPFLRDAIIKKHTTPEIKTIKEPVERKKILQKAISLNKKYDLSNKEILVIDDLYRSGVTLSIVTKVLYNVGKASKVCVLAMTKTRKNE